MSIVEVAMNKTSFESSLATLTENERAALLAAFNSSKGNGHDFGYSDDIFVPGLSKKAVGGVIASLIKKGILSDVDSEFNQFALGGYDANNVSADEWSPARAVAAALGLK